MNFITRVKTPTLCMLGEADIKCPAAQMQDFLPALQVLGVPSWTDLSRGGAWGWEGETQGDIEKRTLRWLEQYLGR